MQYGERIEFKNASPMQAIQPVDTLKISVQDILSNGEPEINIRKAKNSKSVSHSFCGILWSFILRRFFHQFTGQCKLLVELSPFTEIEQPQEAERLAICPGFEDVDLKHSSMLLDVLNLREDSCPRSENAGLGGGRK
jgi:hypothetical protein